MVQDWSAMIGLLVVLFPLLLLAFMLLMERVEGPLRKVAVETQVEEFLETARPDEVDTFVREGFTSALERWRRRRQRLARMLPIPARINGKRS
jgi:hypothetical protein